MIEVDYDMYDGYVVIANNKYDALDLIHSDWENSEQWDIDGVELICPYNGIRYEDPIILLSSFNAG